MSEYLKRIRQEQHDREGQSKAAGPVWYGLRVDVQKELAVRRALRREGETVYLPAIARRKRTQTRSKGRIVIKPMFPGYLLLKAPDAALVPLWMHKLHDAKHTRGFVTLSSDKSPAPIAGGKVEQLKSAIASYFEGEKLRKESGKVKLGKDATITQGPLAGKTGKVTWARGNKVRLFIWLFGSPREVNVERQNVEAA